MSSNDNPPDPAPNQFLIDQTFLAQFFQKFPGLQGAPPLLNNIGVPLGEPKLVAQPTQTGPVPVVDSNGLPTDWIAVQSLHPTVTWKNVNQSLMNHGNLLSGASEPITPTPPLAHLPPSTLANLLNESYNTIEEQRKEIEFLKDQLELPTHLRHIAPFRELSERTQHIEGNEKMFKENIGKWGAERQELVQTVKGLEGEITKLIVELANTKKVKEQEEIIASKKEKAMKAEIKMMKGIINYLKNRGSSNPEAQVGSPMLFSNNLSQVDKMVQQTLARRANQTPVENELEKRHLTQFIENLRRYLEGIMKDAINAAHNQQEPEVLNREELTGAKKKKETKRVSFHCGTGPPPTKKSKTAITSEQL